MSDKIKSLWTHLVRNRGKYIAGMTAAAFLLLMYRNARELEKFMADHDLLEEYNKWLLAGE